LDNSRPKVVIDGHYIYEILGPPNFVDGVALGSYVHHPQWLWTSLVPHQVMNLALSLVPKPHSDKVDDVLNDHCKFLLIAMDDAYPFVLLN